ncbi:MAG: hypothetical protein ACXWU1_08470 [Allosphingosinicella sp.]
MTGFLGFGVLLLRNWQAVVGTLAVAILATLLAIRTDQRDDARTALARERAEHQLLAERIRARAEALARRFTDHARRIEREQQRISQEADHDYQDRIADVRRRAAALRLRPGAAAADSAGAGAAGMPGSRDASGGADGTTGDHRLPPFDAARAGLALEERVVATEQAIRLDALQRWLRAQLGIERSPPDP